MTLYHFLDFCIDYSYMNLLEILPKTTPNQTKNQPVTYKPRSHKKTNYYPNNYNLFNKLRNYYGYNATPHGLD